MAYIGWLIDSLVFNANLNSISAISWHVLDDWFILKLSMFLEFKIFKTWFYMEKKYQNNIYRYTNCLYDSTTSIKQIK